jgi:hypothetical protein
MFGITTTVLGLLYAPFFWYEIIFLTQCLGLSITRALRRGCCLKMVRLKERLLLRQKDNPNTFTKKLLVKMLLSQAQRKRNDVSETRCADPDQA